MVWCDLGSRRHPRSRKRFLYAPPDAPPTIRHKFIPKFGANLGPKQGPLRPQTVSFGRQGQQPQEDFW